MPSKSHADPFANAWGGEGAGGGMLDASNAGRTQQRRSVSLSPRSLEETQAPGGDEHTDHSSKKSGSRIAAQMYQRVSDDPTHHKASDNKPTPKRKGSLGGGPGPKPMLLVCYLCGQQFGTKSLDIHQPQCYVKKLLQWERNTGEFRGPKPISPEEHEKRLIAQGIDSSAAVGGGGGGFGGGGGTMGGGGFGGSGGAMGGGAGGREQFNEAQMQGYTSNLVACDNCGRTFLPDRLEVHSRSCKGPGRGSKPVPRIGSKSPTIGSRRAERSSGGPGDALSTTAPPTPTSSSTAVKKVLPPTPMDDLDALRPSDSDSGIPSSTPVQRQSTDTMSSSSATPKKVATTATTKRPTAPPRTESPRQSLHERMTSNLVACKLCARTFAPDRVAKHESVCKGPQPKLGAKSTSFTLGSKAGGGGSSLSAVSVGGTSTPPAAPGSFSKLPSGYVPPHKQTPSQGARRVSPSPGLAGTNAATRGKNAASPKPGGGGNATSSDKLKVAMAKQQAKTRVAVKVAEKKEKENTTAASKKSTSSPCDSLLMTGDFDASFELLDEIHSSPLLKERRAGSFSRSPPAAGSSAQEVQFEELQAQLTEMNRSSNGGNGAGGSLRTSTALKQVSSTRTSTVATTSNLSPSKVSKDSRACTPPRQMATAAAAAGSITSDEEIGPSVSQGATPSGESLASGASASASVKPKFCGECGVKLGIDKQKFCMECGFKFPA